MKQLSLVFFIFLFANILLGQQRGNSQGPPAGKVYGKVLGDDKSPIE
jgi:hypothetical protein